MSPPVPVPIKPPVSIDELNRIDVRVGTIEALTDVSGSEKLVELRVSFGDHSRQVLVGMKRERADPSEVVGRQALFVVNLPPRRMAGRNLGGHAIRYRTRRRAGARAGSARASGSGGHTSRVMHEHMPVIGD